MEYTNSNIGNTDDWIKAGKITREALEYSRKVIENGTSIYDACQKIENFIRKQSDIAFPVNISMSEFAAHDCADLNDDRTIEGVVKIDVGANVNGAIGDAAITIDLTDKYSEMLEQNKEALNRAVKYATNSEIINVSHIGELIHDYAKENNKGVVLNLTGHGIKRNEIHTDPSIPAYPSLSASAIKKPFVFAIEPFFSFSDTRVIEKGKAKIFQKLNNRPLRDYKARKMLKYIDKFNGNPFTYRWLLDDFSEGEIEFSIMRLIRNGNLIEYKPLVNVNYDVITQFENTVLFTEKPIITTK